MKGLPYLSICLLCASAGFADIITTIDNQQIHGKIVSRSDTALTLKIRKGTMTIPAHRVKYIEYDFETRKAMLDPKDAEGHYELGRALEKDGQIEEAVRFYRKAVKLNHPPPEAFLKLAEYHDRDGQPQLAITYYRQYLKRNPDRPDIKKRIQTLTRQLNNPDPRPNTDPNNKTRGARAAQTIPAWEGLEVKGRWREERWANRAFLQTVDAEGDRNNKLLSVAFVDRGKDKVAFHHVIKENFSTKQGFRFDAYNASDRPVTIAIAIRTNPGQQWFESRHRTLRPDDWTTDILFDFANGEYKSEARGWRYLKGIENLDNTYQIVILIYNKSVRQGQIFLDNIRVLNAVE